MKRILAALAVLGALLVAPIAANAGTLMETSSIDKKRNRMVAEAETTTPSGNWLRLRIFIPAFEQGSEPSFFLEVTSRDPNTAFDIETTSLLRGAQTLWISVPTEQQLRTNQQGITQFQAVRLLSPAQFYRAVFAAGSP